MTPSRPPTRSEGVSSVLIVEDSATQAAALEHLLTSEGFSVRIARSAELALAQLARERSDLVLSDVVMPGMDGYELCRRIKATAASADTPVVLLTSLNDPLAIVRGLACGADHYVTKPYQPEWLLTRLRAVLARTSSEHVPPPEEISVELLGTRFAIRATKEQILELLVSSYSDLVRTSEVVRDAERRARFLADAGELLSSSLDSLEVLRELARLAVPRLADVCAVDLLDADGRRRRVEIAHALDGVATVAPSEDGASDPLSPSASLTRAIAERTSQLIVAAEWRDLGDVARDPPLIAALERRGATTMLVVPLVARGRVLGVLQFLALEGARLSSADDLLFIEDLARRAALAVDNALLYGEAQRATRARDDVLAIVSHDLRNPLNTIQMSTSFLLDVLGTPGFEVPLVAQLQIMRRATKRANALIQDLLDVSRIDAGTLAVAEVPTSASLLLSDAALEEAPSILAKGLTLEHEWHGPDVDVAVDRSRISQLFANLVGNAVKFTSAGGTISLRGEMHESRVVYEVRDSGAGIAPEHLPHLFDRFWQATQTSRAGAGLGLYIVKGIVDAHRGAIDVQSDPGVGTRIRVELPIAR
ncbi:MAG: hybrid sensor histidine kinase/response regulator [Gemmatimonadaceae bacterium]|nr:hybrid sensor histidine kinase/response regulator [Gemmatimonadaceae bacterium]